MTSPRLTRRTMMAAAAALPLAPIAARAEAPMLGVDMAPYRRFKLGGFEVTTLLAGTATRPDPQTIFGMNVSAEDFNAASEQANIPSDQVQFFFTHTVINTGSELVLFDTGLNAEGMHTALEAAGYTSDMIDLVVITHMHGDHIGGLMENGAPTFPNARYELRPCFRTLGYFTPVHERGTKWDTIDGTIRTSIGQRRLSGFMNRARHRAALPGSLVSPAHS